MLDVLVFFLFMVAAGYALRRTGLARPETAKDLNHVVFNLTLPPLIFLALHRATLSPDMLALPAIAWGITLVALALGLLLAWALRLPRPLGGAMVLALTFGNTTFLGYPIVQGFYGDEHLTLAIFYDMLGTSLAVNTLGVAVASSLGGEPARVGLMARRLLLFPPIWALALGLALHGVALPPVVETLLGRLGDLTTPLIMLSLGLTLQFRHWRQNLGLVGAIAVMRLAVLPALVLVAARLMGLPPAYQQAAVMQAAMPTMFFAMTLAMIFGLDATLVVNAIMVTTLLGFVTLPIWQAFL